MSRTYSGRTPTNSSALGTDQLAVHEVHRRVADEAGDEEGGGVVVDLSRRAALHHAAPLHHHDLVGHDHRLGLVVGDVDGGHAQGLLELLEFGPHAGAQDRVEIAEGFIHQEELRLANDGAAQRYALLLPARELTGALVQVLGDAQPLRHLAHAPIRVGFAHAAHPQVQADVAVDAHVGIQGVVLKGHRHVAGFGLRRRHVLVAKEDPARGGRLEPRQDAQRGGFAATRWTQEHGELPVGELQVEGLQSDLLPEVLGDPLEANRAHPLPRARTN